MKQQINLEHQFAAYFENSLNADARRQFEEALKSSAPLRAKYEAYKKLRQSESLLAKRQHSLSANFEARVMERIEQAEGGLWQRMVNALRPPNKYWMGSFAAVAAAAAIALIMIRTPPALVSKEAVFRDLSAQITAPLETSDIMESEGRDVSLREETEPAALKPGDAPQVQAKIEADALRAHQLPNSKVFSMDGRLTQEKFEQPLERSRPASPRAMQQSFLEETIAKESIPAAHGSSAKDQVYKTLKSSLAKGEMPAASAIQAQELAAYFLQDFPPLGTEKVAAVAVPSPLIAGKYFLYIGLEGGPSISEELSAQALRAGIKFDSDMVASVEGFGEAGQTTLEVSLSHFTGVRCIVAELTLHASSRVVKKSFHNPAREDRMSDRGLKRSVSPRSDTKRAPRVARAEFGAGEKGPRTALFHNPDRDLSSTQLGALEVNYLAAGGKIVFSRRYPIMLASSESGLPGLQDKINAAAASAYLIRLLIERNLVREYTFSDLLNLAGRINWPNRDRRTQMLELIELGGHAQGIIE